MYTTIGISGFGRNVFCALAACVLTIVLLGGIGEAPAKSAQLVALQLAQA